MRTAAEILDEHGLRPPSSAPGRYTTTCPKCSAGRSKAHQRSACLGITIDAKGVKFGCNHCGWTGGEYYNGKANGHDRANPFVAIYDYTDENGVLLIQVCRKPDKMFLQRKPDGSGGWTWKTGDVRKVLYRLPELHEAMANERVIAIVEGEKDCEALRRIGVPATCNPGGASEPGKKSKWRSEYSEMLRRADIIIIIPDNDEPGRAHAEAIASMSLGIAKRVRILDLAKHWPSCPAHGDTSDWLGAGHAREQLDVLIDGAPDFSVEAKPSSNIILKLDEWLARELPEPDFILGHWLTTTSRVLLNVPTGLGKTMFSVALGLAAAAGMDFLHWRGIRPARVLFIDGEMSRRLLLQRLADEVHRIGAQPQGMHIISHEDIEGFPPLNTSDGQTVINNIIDHMGGADLVLFDNVMSLVGGDHKDEEGWRQIMPWVRSLTRRSIGQVWVHHTGHDETRGYGTKTREWQMDTVAHLEEVRRPDADLSFSLNFRKARERTPSTREDFADVRIALLGDRWTWEAAEGGRRAKVSPLAAKFLKCLTDACTTTIHDCPAASLDDWWAECVRRGVLEPDKPNSQRALFSKYKRELIAANQTACNLKMAWVL
jgi:AAA domain